MTVTVAVANTDFGTSDEYISGVYLGGEKIGNNYLVNDGQDSNCGIMSRILDAVDMPQSVQAAAIRDGQFSVRITTSPGVNCCPCNGFVLYAQVTVTWRALVTSYYIPSPWENYQFDTNNMVLQYSASTRTAGPARFRDVPRDSSVFDRFTASVTPRSLFSLVQPSDTTRSVRKTVVFYFRLSMLAGGTRMHGPQSNPISLVPAFPSEETVSANDGSRTVISPMIAATWHSDVLRIFRVVPLPTSASSFSASSGTSTETYTDTRIGHFSCNQVRQGAVALDSTNERLFVLVEPLTDTPNGQQDLLVVNVRQRGRSGGEGYMDSSAQISRVQVQVENVSLWNVELDDKIGEVRVCFVRVWR